MAKLEPSILNFAGPLGVLNERLYELAKTGHQVVSVVNVGPPGVPAQTADHDYHFMVFLSRVVPEVEQLVP